MTGGILMRRTDRSCYPGQVLALNLKRGSALVATDGALRLEYRDQSLDWLLDAAPDSYIRLEDGAQYVLPCNAFVKIQPEGAQAVTCTIMRPWSLVSRVLARLNVAWSSNRMVSKAES
jgi:hypothetical protein